MGATKKAWDDQDEEGNRKKMFREGRERFLTQPDEEVRTATTMSSPE
jgi:hypothetical protein